MDVRFSPTLAWYIFKDLLKIFLMASGALAGIMSFGGLLRPLTQQGLDGAQVGQLLTYFTPAMTAYSLPIAALFAATVVYGRLSADNELTACRAGGLSHLSIAVPAAVLGLLVALISLLLLSFIVPSSTLQVEKVIYSNIAKLIANRIDRTHQIKFGTATVFAQEAHLPQLSREQIEAGEQQVVLIGPTIVTFERPREDDWHYRVPSEFWTASQATVFISRGKTDDEIELLVELKDGAKFPRDFKGGLQASVASTYFGPMEISSPIKENVKFMNVFQLHRLYQNMGESRKIQRLQEDFIDGHQQHKYLWLVRDALNEKGKVVFRTLGGDEYELSRGPNMAFEYKGELVVGPTEGDLDKSGYSLAGRVSAREETPGGGASAPGVPDQPVQLVRVIRGEDGNQRIDAVMSAADVRLRVRPRRDDDRLDVTVEMRGATIPTQEGPVARSSVVETFRVPIPRSIRELERMPVGWFVSDEAKAFDRPPNQLALKRELIILTNDLISESHARVSFAISCLILVMVGCALGMMFRSGNFLTAFAVSFAPALLSITLIIAGQRVCSNIGWKIEDPSFQNPLKLGLALIWSGNIANTVIATTLLWRLHRT